MATKKTTTARKTAPATKTAATRRPSSRSTKVLAVTAPVTEAVVEAVVEAPVAEATVTPLARIVARMEFEATVRHEAYLRAQQRNFRDGSPFADWLAAEADVRARLAAEGATLAG